MKPYIKRLLVLLFTSFSLIIANEKSVSIIIDENETINNTLNLLTKADVLNFGDYNSEGLAYFFRVNTFSVDLTTGGMDLTLNTTAYIGYATEIIGADISVNITLDISADFDLVYDSGVYKLILDNFYLNPNIENWPDEYLPSIPDFFNLYAATCLENLVLFTIPNPFPEIDPNLFETTAPLIELTDDAIIVYLTVQSMTVLANKDINNQDEYLGGTLSLYNTSNSTLNKLNKPSPSTVSVNAGDTYHAKTHSIELSGLYHKTWTEDIDYKLTTTTFPMENYYIEQNIIAYFDEKNSVTMSVNPSSVTNEVIQYHDPWYYNESTQTQPDCYRTISPGTYSVFLDQNENFYDNIPIYSLKAPHCGGITQNVIYGFSEWEAFDDSDQPVSTNSEWIHIEHPGEHETSVVFKKAGVKIQAKYIAANEQENYQLELEDNISFPAGGEYEIASGFQIVTDNLVEIIGSPGNEIVFNYSDESNTEILFNSYDNMNLQYVRFNNFKTEPIFLVNETASIDHCVFNNCDETLSGDCGDMVIANCTFYESDINSEFDIYSNQNFECFNCIFDNCHVHHNLTNISYCLGHNVTGIVMYYLDDCISGDPLFIDPGNGDFHIHVGSPCKDAGDPDTQYNDPDGTRSDMGAYYFPQLSGTISENKTMETDFSLGGNITVSSGVTLTLNPGVTVSGNDKKITVYGTLDVNGTANARVDISDTYIYGGSGSTVEIDYADISDSYSNGLEIYDGIGKVSHSTFVNNNTYGLKFSSPRTGSEIGYSTFSDNISGAYISGSALSIHDNSMTNNDFYGLYLVCFNGTVSDNWFENNKYGIRFSNGGNADLTTVGPYPWAIQGDPGEQNLNNIFRNNIYYGILVYSSTTPMLGTYGPSGGLYRGGYNAFINAGASYYIKSYNSSLLDIRINFWDVPASSVLNQVDGNFYTSNYYNLYIDPGSLSKTNSGSSSQMDCTYEYDLSPLEKQLFEGDSLMFDSLYSEAFKIYDYIIDNSPDADEARVALNRIIYIYWNQEKQDELVSYLNGLHSKYPKNLIGTIAYDYTTPLFAMEGNIDKAICRNDEVVDIYDILNEPDYAAEALFENMTLYESVTSDSSAPGGLPKESTAVVISKVNDYKTRILSNYPKTGVAEFLREMYNIPVPVEIDLPEEFALHSAYPNPFNPMTTIEYDLPVESGVTLIIYDILGREVKRLVDTKAPAGFYRAIWDGRNKQGQLVSSGVYIYRIHAGGFTMTNKMIFMR